MSSSSILLNQLRQIMKSKQYFNEIIHAYIVPTTDPHRVNHLFQGNGQLLANYFDFNIYDKDSLEDKQ
jgi:hypothetical protein